MFQVVFLQEFYTNSKIDSIKNVTSNISYNLDYAKKDEFKSFLEGQARDYDVCIRIIYQDNNETTAKDYMVDNLKGCKLISKSVTEMFSMIADTETNGGSYLFEEEQKSTFTPQIVGIQNTPNFVNGTKSYTYAQTITNDQYTAAIMVSTFVAPVNATVVTLKNQFIYIAMIVVMSAILLALALSRRIVQPIQRITKEAKQLAFGAYKTPDIKENYIEIKELNETLSDASEMIKIADKAKRDLIANVSHDLRTPLTMISGYGEMMRDLPGENNVDNAQVIIDEAKRLSFLVNDLIDLSSLQDRKLKIKTTKISVHKLLKDIYKQYERYVKNEGFSFKLELSEDAEIIADPERIKQVLYNFINNAINYSKEDKYVLIRQTKFEDHILIEVVDHGSGIDQKKLRDIWDRYYKIDAEHIRSNVGSGIGLAISKEILVAHQFKYGVTSTIEKGSNFFFEIPINKNKS